MVRGILAVLALTVPLAVAVDVDVDEPRIDQARATLQGLDRGRVQQRVRQS